MVDSLRESQLGIDDIYNRAVKLEAFATSGAMLGRQRVLSHPDFRTLPVVPASEELLARELPHLTPNRVRGSYNSTEHYLDVQFRLLREDFVRPLREGIRECARAQEVRGYRYRKEIFHKLDGVNVHSGVVVISSSVNADGRVYVVQFDASSFSKILWKGTRRFIPGSLLCFSKDNFETIQVATVSRATPSMLGRGVVEVTFWNCSCAVTGQFVVLESIAYFEGYRHVFQALQNTHVLPLEKYIVGAESVVFHPSYVNNWTTFDITCLLETPGGTRRKVTLLDRDSWPKAEELQLDSCQLEALQYALTHELGVIQGPPGTGKTYMGLKIVQTLLENDAVWGDDQGPILVVCYTNRALDQFLEGVLQFTKLVTRMGGGCKNNALKMYHVNKKCKRTHAGRQSSEALRKHLERVKTLSTLSQTVLSVPEEEDAVKLLMHVMSKACCRSFFQAVFDEHSFCQVFRVWLRLEQTKALFLNQCSKKDMSSVHKAKKGFNMRDLDTSSWEAHLRIIIKEGDRATGDDHVEDVWTLRSRERWKLYRYWVDNLTSVIDTFQTSEMTTMEDVQERMAHSRLMADLSVLRASKVIGMTTTCAAKYQALLREVQPRIVIVEEAAEVLEAHVVTSLAPQTQHVILIGDHQQLRPPTNVQELSIRYKMDVSLFERMLINGVGVKQLCVQHRMRPDFARLLTPRFYPTLEPHPCVERYEDIEGMTTNMFFFNYSSPERRNSGRSYSNVFEANFLVNLCRYLLAQGYQPSQITLLTPYMGQKKLLERTANTYHELTAVAITVVDNFQGEENDIILLSLVRSNETGETGFVQVANRICVLLSRARMGFYCVGNMTLLSEASNLWRDIVDDLKYRGLVGCELKLRCRRHSNSTAVVRTPEDFPSGRNGFCNLPCPASLPCGHSCPKNCHMDTEDHKLFTCRERCGKTCSRGHCCNERCHGHCTRCTVHIKVEFPACHHTSKVPCYMADEATCTKKCGRRLKSCGHPCGKKCGELCGGACMVSNVEGSRKEVLTLRPYGHCGVS
ncbi:NFX1-type zinc finger-containing protein 1-like [Ornithodoros turicata]|uniref:NFX1-type zinc finger-containing protein 1-like n=1 Tax=Ornithodoros turicata TaxID=34597 RepID=UPI003139231E